MSMNSPLLGIGRQLDCGCVRRFVGIRGWIGGGSKLSCGTTEDISLLVPSCFSIEKDSKVKAAKQANLKKPLSIVRNNFASDPVACTSKPRGSCDVYGKLLRFRSFVRDQLLTFPYLSPKQ